MSFDREEIRWRFQLFLENIKTVMVWAENQRQILSKAFDKEIKDVEKTRNYFLAAIAFGVTIGASLIVAEKIENFYSFYLITAAIIGIVIFMLTNLYIYKKTDEQTKINLSYFDAINGELLPLMGDITTLALKEDHKKEDLDLVQNYIATYAVAIGFDVSMTLMKTLKLEDIDKKRFEEGFQNGKNNLENFKKFNFKLGTKRIEKFIDEFEKMKKLKKKK